MLKPIYSAVDNDRNQDLAAEAGFVWCHGRRCREFMEVVFFVIFWYTISVGLIISNKWLISETGFRSTSMLTLLHMLSSCAASNMLLALGLVPRKQVGSQLLGRVAVLAVSFTLAVATCMASLAYLPASFVQAIGSITPGFTAVLAFLIQGRREAAVTYAALVPVAIGIVLASGGEPLFNLVGLLLQIVACLARSLKTVLQAVLLTDERDHFHPMTLLAYTTAISAALLTLLTLATEPNSLHQLAQLHAAHQSFTPLLALSCGLAFLANWTNFIISKRLGALTLQVLGNFKNVVAAVAAVAVFSNPVTRLGLLGYGMTTLGVFLYSNLVHKYPAAWVPAPVSAFLGTSFTYRPPTQGVQEGKGKEECSDDREPSGGSRTSSEGGLRPELANGHGRDVEYAGASRSKRAAVRVVEERAPLVT